MISQFEKWLFVGIGFIIFSMLFIAVYAVEQRNSCRADAMKANRSADEIVKICP